MEGGEEKFSVKVLISYLTALLCVPIMKVHTSEVHTWQFFITTINCALSRKRKTTPSIENACGMFKWQTFEILIRNLNLPFEGFRLAYFIRLLT